LIRDPKVRAEIALEWSAVKKLSDHRARGYMIPGAYINEPEPPDGFYNLPFFLAFAVLDRVLAELIEQGTIRCSGRKPFQLGTKMGASKGVVQWQDYDRIDKGKAARNDLAHNARLISKAECLSYIQAIEAELKAWKVLE
jgi:hypothetical protein